MSRRQFLRQFAFAIVTFTTLKLALPIQAHEGDQRIRLTGAGGSGTARFRSRETTREFQIEAENLRLAAGSLLTVKANGVSIGTMIVTTSRSARLNLSAERRQPVPAIDTGSTIEILDAAGNTLMSGAF